MRLQSKKNPAELLAALLLIGIFGISALLLAVSGSDVYHRISKRMDSNSQLRTGLSFAVNLVRSADKQDVLAEKNALIIRQRIDGSEYRTYLYCRDGWLMELFAAADYGWTPEEGERLCRMEDFSAVWESDGLLSLQATSSIGESRSVCVLVE